MITPFQNGPMPSIYVMYKSRHVGDVIVRIWSMARVSSIMSTLFSVHLSWLQDFSPVLPYAVTSDLLNRKDRRTLGCWINSFDRFSVLAVRFSVTKPSWTPLFPLVLLSQYHKTLYFTYNRKTSAHSCVRHKINCINRRMFVHDSCKVMCGITISQHCLRLLSVVEKH